jgi:catechol 2,3-dioxygenase-like lactoylglutathione lyase family enzyme
MAVLDGVYLEVGDWEAVVECRQFYESVLGLRVASETDGESVWFDVADRTFGIHTGEGPAKDTRWAINLVFNVDRTTTVDAEATRLKDLGVKLYMEPTDMEWGRRVITFLDPAGHAIWYCEPLPS